MKEKLTFRKEYFASPNAVWKAITSGEALGEWFMSGTFIAQEGAEFEFSEPNFTARGTVLEVVANRKLRYLWVTRRENQEDKDEDGNAGVASIVTWNLTPTESGGTALVLENDLLEAPKPVVLIEAAVNWSYAIHSSLAAFLKGKYRQPTPIVYVSEEPNPSPDALSRAGFRQPEAVTK